MYRTAGTRRYTTGTPGSAGPGASRAPVAARPALFRVTRRCVHPIWGVTRAAHSLRSEVDAMLRKLSLVNTVLNGTMEPLVRALASTACQQLAAAAAQDMRARYELGRALRTIREGTSPSDPFIEAVAQALGVHPSLLRRYMRVATLISPSQFEVLAAMRDRRGMPMTWSHVEHLADVRSKAQRTLIAEQAIAEGLSVRALRLRIRRERAANQVTPAASAG